MSFEEAGQRIAFFGGSFDPVHRGHIEIARALTAQFGLDGFVFVPALHAPHKRENKPASPFHRFAMLSLATGNDESLFVSTIELEDPEHPYSIQTLTRLKAALPEKEIFFVIGADSWQEITTWRRWEEVLTVVNIIVVTRPEFSITFDHVTDEIAERVVDVRRQEAGVGSQETEGGSKEPGDNCEEEDEGFQYSALSTLPIADGTRIFITDAVSLDVSATAIRRMIREGVDDWERSVPASAVKHIKKYGLYR